MYLVTSPVVINVPTRGLLAVETMHTIVQWLANLNIKRNMTSMFTFPESEGSKTNPSNRFLTVKNTILFLIGVPSQFSHNGLSDWLTGKA